MVGVVCPVCNRESDVHDDGVGDYYACEHVGRLTMDRYPPHWITLATGRGWDRDAHQRALDSGDWEAIALTHPTNLLTEDEVER